jgi:hypothetical protein
MHRLPRRLQKNRKGPGMISVGSFRISACPVLPFIQLMASAQQSRESYHNFARVNIAQSTPNNLD